MISKKFAVFGSDGLLVSRLDSDVNVIPDEAIEISHDIFVRMIVENDGVWRYRSGKIVKEPLPAPTQKEIQDQVNAEARAYLAKTDWYVTRMQENGQPVPDDIAVARQAARERVVE